MVKQALRSVESEHSIQVVAVGDGTHVEAGLFLGGVLGELEAVEAGVALGVWVVLVEV
jgi:hypothetical protein